MSAHSSDGAQFSRRDRWIRAWTAERRPGLRLSPSTCSGFSLVELLVSMAILLVISGGVVSAISTSEQAYSRTEVKSAMYENVRGVAELMAQEIGQAGLASLPSSPAPTLNAAVTASGLAQNVAVTPSTASMYLAPAGTLPTGEQLLIDAGPNEELVTLSNLTATTITAIFGKSHAAGATITALGAFPYGVVTPGTTDGSTATVLNLFGDINGDGTLVYVRYTCAPGTTAAPGTLTRSVTTITPGGTALNPAQNLLTTLIANPGGTPCFQYTTQPAVLGYTFTTGVGITLSVQTMAPDPQTHQYLTMTKSFLNLEPRNVLVAYELAGVGISTRLQTTPANVLVY
jgi:prepilin-type N-terminal cleavage/methylation domain-containing protein